MYDRVADRPVRIERVSLERRERETTSDFTRVTTTVQLHGDGATGYGEDVCYEAADHDPYPDVADDLVGRWSLDTYSDTLEDSDLWPAPPSRESARHLRRWAFESAALDLALRQADTDLGTVLDRSYDPVRFVVSTRLEGPDGPSADRVHRLRETRPGLEFKLDPTPEWPGDLVAELADTGAVRVLDLKSHYDHPDVETSTDAAFYRRIREGVPEALLEDPKLTDANRDALAGAEDRLAWDYPITDVASVEALPVEPRWLNCKPSRFGTVESLFDFLAFCEREGIALYGGGQFELGPGRAQIQALASLCYPDGPNDVAPSAYNDPDHEGERPGSPLAPPADPVGFGGGGWAG